jgi:hypothetical protein|tara:strand:+ start:148 stop:771 length:624 start_codon:yes stop_codon:yes gene_type:complete
MTTKSAYQRQPTKLDYASPTQFRFNIIKLPKVEYYCTAVNIPGVSLNNASLSTPLKEVPLPGTTLTYEPLVITFMVDENLENYREIHGWLTGLGFPKDWSQFKNLLAGGEDRFPPSGSKGIQTEPGKIKPPTDEGAIYSDATLTVLTSKNNPNLEVRFRDVYPFSLSTLSYNQQATDVEYLIAEVGFQYKIYEWAEVGATRTTETVS